MALLRLELKNYNKRGTLPVGAHARYLIGPSIREHAAHNLGERPQERPREDLVASGQQHMPAWAQGDTLVYWEAAQQYSRTNACLGKEIVISLPHELGQEHNLQLIRSFLATLPPYPTTWAYHEPQTRNGQLRQSHCHILVSPRQDMQQGQGAAWYFRQPNQGGVPSQRLWTKRQQVFALRKTWETLLRETLRQHGLEHTLARHHGAREIPLSWREMRDLRLVIQAHDQRTKTGHPYWGHEYRIPPAQIACWKTENAITTRQANWLAVRGQRQLAYRQQQLAPQLWEHTARMEAAKPWQLLAKHQARQGQQRVEQALASLRQQQRQLGQVYLTWLAPELHKAQQAYRQQKQHERGQGRGTRRRRARERTQQTGRSGVEVAALDAQMEHGLRQGTQRHGWER